VIVSSPENALAVALGCRAHTGWAALAMVAGGIAQPQVLFRGRIDLADPTGRIRKNVYQAARALDPADAASRIQAAERVATEQAAAAVEEILRNAADEGTVVRSCAVVVGSFRSGMRLESILASHALAHAAEGRLYQTALLQAAATCGIEAVAVPKQSIWEQGEATLGLAQDELRRWIDGLRREIGPPWAEDQKLAALAGWITLAQAA
jgi:hypothetical protein